MAASADTNFNIARGETQSYPVAAATTLYKGAMISVVDGYAQALTDGTRFNGHVVGQVANTTAEGFGTAGDLNVRVYTGKYKSQITLDNVNGNMIGAYVYAVNDNTYTLVPMMTPVGRVVEYVTTDTAIVEFDTEIGRRTMGNAVVGVFLPFFENIVDGCVETNNSGVAKVWTRTSVNGPGIIQGINVADSPSPYCNGIKIIPDTAENDSEELQMSGEMFYLDATTKPVFVGWRMMVADADQTDTIIGLSITDSTILAGVTDSITIRIADAAATAKLYVEKNSTETASGSAITTLTDGGYVSLGFVYDGTYVYPYVDGVAGTAVAVTNLPNDEALTLSISHTAGAATDGGLTLNFLDAYQIV